MNELDKPYDLKLEIRPGYLYARIHSETITPEMTVAYLHEVTDRCHKLGRTRLLVERDIPATLSDADVYFSGTEFAHMGIESIRIAFVDARAENAEHLEFAMLVANNRGGHLKLFKTVPEAETWLETAA